MDHSGPRKRTHKEVVGKRQFARRVNAAVSEFMSQNTFNASSSVNSVVVEQPVSPSVPIDIDSNQGLNKESFFIRELTIQQFQVIIAPVSTQAPILI